MASNPQIFLSDAGGAFSYSANGYNVGAGDTVVCKLQNTAGVVAWNLSCVGTDELSAIPQIQITGTGNSTRTFTAGAAGSTFILQSQTTDSQGSQEQITFGVFVLTSGSTRVLAVSERYESDPVFGWVKDLNPGIRGAGTFTLWTYHSAITTSTALSRLLYQIQPVNTTDGTFTLTLPTSPSTGDRVDIEDVGATSATTGIGATALTISGTSNDVQNPHTMAVSSASYTFGPTSGDAGGATLCLRYTGTFWKVIGN